MFELFRATAEDKSWYRAHPLKMLKAIGTDANALQNARKDAVAKNESQDKVLGFSLPLQISEVTQNQMWWQEKLTKVGSVLPIAFGLLFWNSAVNAFNNSEGIGRLTSVVVGLAGLAAIALGPILTYRTGQALGEMREWMEKNEHTTAYLGIMRNGSRQRT